jgi:predicted KAP-like P-loop ATPase
MKKNIIHNFLPDKPLRLKKDDRLGYSKFAENLSRGLINANASEGLVVSLNGKWGSGKTTILNFIFDEIDKFPESQKPIVIRFNPWWFSGQDDLIRNFFDQLRTTLDSKELEIEGLKDLIGDFAQAVGDYYPDLPWQARIITRFLFKVHPTQNIPELKNKISEKLAKLDRRIFVVIDDIDRLIPEEIRQIFRLIKAVADFPNIIYILAFDKDVAIKSLESIQKISGSEYLEKIVQASFDVPTPEKSLLNTLFTDKLNQIFNKLPQKSFETNRWQSVFFDGIEKFLLTPRSVTKFYNSMSITYPALKNEVNPVDFVAIESLRQFSPYSYDIIRLNEKQFTGEINRSAYSNDKNNEELIKFHKNWIAQIPDPEANIVSHILPTIFPKLSTIFGGRNYDSDDPDEWRMLRRVSHSDIYPVYFGFTVSSNSLSSSEVESVIKMTGDAKALEHTLLELTKQNLSSGKSKVRNLLERLRDYTPSYIPKKNIPNIINVLFNIGDKLLLIQDERDGFFDYDNDVLIGRIIWSLLSRQDKKTNFKVLKKAITLGSSLSIITHEVGVFGQQFGRHSNKVDPENERLLEENDLNKLEEVCLNKIKSYADNNLLLSQNQFNRIIYRWRDWSKDKEEIGDWVNNTTKNDKNLAVFIEKFLSKNRSYGSSGVKITYRLDPKWLEDFCDISLLVERAKSLLKKTKLSKNQKLAISILIKEAKLRSIGKNPDDPFRTD